MTATHSFFHESGPVSVLFHPNTVPIVDIFRCISSFDDQYDLALLNGPEQALMGLTRPEAAKAIISDALLLAFALDRQRSQPLQHGPMNSRRGSMDEYCLMALIGSARMPDSELAFEAASVLGVASLDLMTSLASDLIRQIDNGGLMFTTPSVSEFRGVVGERVLFEDDLGEVLGRSELRFRF
ncbi:MULTISPECIES: hypothetical protein [Microvirga]|uniref:hypothetical protein n=1 Tax=Microvirga TaxID=186650 RepID=UPI001CFFF275|nr:hypothetical protein [Microvirga lenta]MCB5176391.1 hypothetical protein [Microvirga lenta]